MPLNFWRKFNLDRKYRSSDINCDCPILGSFDEAIATLNNFLQTNPPPELQEEVDRLARSYLYRNGRLKCRADF